MPTGKKSSVTILGMVSRRQIGSVAPAARRVTAGSGTGFETGPGKSMRSADRSGADEAGLLVARRTQARLASEVGESRRRFGSRSSRQLFDAYRKSVRRTVALVKRALANRDHETIADLAHKEKGACGWLGFRTSRELWQALMTAAIEEDWDAVKINTGKLEMLFRQQSALISSRSSFR